MNDQKNTKILKPDAFMKIEWNWSFVLLFGSILINFFLFFNFMTYVRKWLFPILRKKEKYIGLTKIIIRIKLINKRMKFRIS